MSTCKLIKLGLAAAILLSVSAVSHAADVVGGPAYGAPPPVPLFYSWTGFYAGGHLGVGWANGGSAGFLGGGQVGFNYQINPQWVLGVEADIAGTTIKDSVNATVVGPGAVLTANATASLDWVSTLAGRFGYAFDRWLVYGKVGGAWAHASATVTSGINGMTFGSVSLDQTASGWMLGVGTEYALWNNWSAKVEYNMMDFGNDNPFADNKFHVFKAGINYRFGGPGGFSNQSSERWNGENDEPRHLSRGFSLRTDQAK
jgi:outer membrane immunogenic protein